MVLTSLLVLVNCVTLFTDNEQESAFPCQRQWIYFRQGVVRCVPTLMLVKCSISLLWKFNWTSCIIALYSCQMHILALLCSHPQLSLPRNKSWHNTDFHGLVHCLFMNCYIYEYPRGLVMRHFSERKLTRHLNCMVSVCAGKLMWNIHSSGQLHECLLCSLKCHIMSFCHFSTTLR